jgi:hypothetical protein
MVAERAIALFCVMRVRKYLRRSFEQKKTEFCAAGISKKLSLALHALD